MDYEVFKHLYISPLEKCNLNCKICYTKKTDSVLSNTSILDFIDKYAKEIGVETVTFCGGEVFLLKDFPKLVNILTDREIFVQIITNGTINKLSQLKTPNLINIIVSLDGLASYHDKNRGKKMYKRSLNFLNKAQKLGFHTEIFSIVTKENLSNIDRFEKFVKVPVTYHPRKPLSYLKEHPTSNIIGQTKGFSFISKQQRLKLGQTKKIFPPLNFGCFQISLMSDGLVYGCCEGRIPLGSINDEPKNLINNLTKRLDKIGCAEPNFKCGLN